uniref:Uncharacterized protein n=1 Tax=Dictyoglomus turgidum TaxID=513050 RepID=A0A7C3SN39_9BACT
MVNVPDSLWEQLVISILEGSKVDKLIDEIDRLNEKTRYYLWIRYYDLAIPRETLQLFSDWPKIVETKIISYEPITKERLENFLKNLGGKPSAVLCTDDPAGKVGWKEKDVFFT